MRKEVKRGGRDRGGDYMAKQRLRRQWKWGTFLWRGRAGTHMTAT